MDIVFLAQPFRITTSERAKPKSTTRSLRNKGVGILTVVELVVSLERRRNALRLLFCKLVQHENGNIALTL